MSRASEAAKKKRWRHKVKPPVGYDPLIVKEFLDAHGAREDGMLMWLNEHRLTDSQRNMVRRWETAKLVPLDRLDALLMKCDLMLFELEHWAEQHYGRDGWEDAA